MKRIRKTAVAWSATSPTVGLSLNGRRLSSSIIRVCAIAVALGALWLAFDPAPLTAKKKGPPTSKTVVGQVFDASDNPIAGAAVEMTDLSTNKTSAIYTGPDGRFTFTDIKFTKDYQFKAHFKGQSSEVRKVSSWDTRTDMVLNLHIPAPKDE
ncbi:MAG TPA: carboxypeptidase-like regulatory domain-containing protein [Terriglobia bacterium]|nr:carboxypeptidase-like regulatory domain-containing protein [Terriglobia bacterium]